MRTDAVIIWRLAPGYGDAITCDHCGAHTMVYDDLTWLTNREALQRDHDDEQALLRLYTAEAQRQARGNWTPYQRLQVCHSCMVERYSADIGSEHAPAAFELLGMDRQCAILGVIFHPENDGRQHKMLSAAPVGATPEECRQVIVNVIAEAPGVR